MAVTIESIERGSPAAKSAIKSGDRLLTINGNVVRDVLDYRFYMTDTHLEIKLEREGVPIAVTITKAEYDDLGLEFESYLMDNQHHCRNKCIFCFVDQLPKGLRDSLYFKDDDSRMSFLFGSYVTLTNMTEEDIRRIIKMRISPINISVHTTNPELRVMMLGNPAAADSLRFLPMLTEAGIKINTQLVICPTVNDGDELLRSLTELAALYPGLQSIAVVPVGVTRHREGLHPLSPMTADEAAHNLDIVERFGETMIARHGKRIAFAADELFIQAGRPLPDADYYEEFDQLEDGVGIHALLRQEFAEELEYAEPDDTPRTVSIASGTAAAPLLSELVTTLQDKFPATTVHVYGVENKLFGDTVNVSGLLCGNDLHTGLRDKELGERLLIPSVMLRHEGDIFLDDTDLPWLQEQLAVPINVINMNGSELLQAILEKEG